MASVGITRPEASGEKLPSAEVMLSSMGALPDGEGSTPRRRDLIERRGIR